MVMRYGQSDDTRRNGYADDVGCIRVRITGWKCILLAVRKIVVSNNVSVTCTITELSTYTSDAVTNRFSNGKMLFALSNALFCFLHVVLRLERTNPMKTIIDHSFRHCHQVHYLLPYHWLHHSWPMTPGKCEVLVLWGHFRRLLSHAQFDAKLTFTRK